MKILKSRRSLRPILFIGLFALLPGCGGDDPAGPPSDPLEIAVTGVEDGAVYEAPVTIDIQTTRGSYSATLDGETFFPGSTVSDIGAHTLIVTARDGVDSETVRIDFEIRLGGDSFLIVRMFNLGDNDAGGGGDAILLTDSSAAFQQHALFDAGPAGIGGSNPGYVANRLAELGVSNLEALILTHAHSDHFDGLPHVLDQLDVERFIYNGQVRYYSEYTDLIAQAEASADTVIIPSDTVALELAGQSGTSVIVLPPLADYLNQAGAESSELNNGSLGTAVARGDFSMFLTGDGEVEANNRWRLSYGEFTGDLDVLKIGHHGANDAIFDNGFSGSSSWLDHTDPETMLISANGTTHPRHNALTKILGRSNTRTYCTHVHGEVTLRVNPAGEYAVSVEKNAEMDCVPGEDATT